MIGINNAYGDPVLDHRSKAKKDKHERVEYIPRPWVDVCWFCDSRWFSWHYLNLKEFPGIIAHCAVSLNKVGMHYFLRGKPGGIETREGHVAWNGNAGYSAINFAYHLGCKRVVLLGFDMKRVSGSANWHHDHPADETKNPWFRFLRRTNFIKRDAEKIGLEIINCTPGSAIDAWPIMSLEEFLSQEEGNVDDTRRKVRERQD